MSRVRPQATTSSMEDEEFTTMPPMSGAASTAHTEPLRARRNRSTLLKVICIVVAVLGLCAASMWVYTAERDKAQNTLQAGVAADTGLDVTVYIGKVDPAALELSAQFQIEPRGALADTNDWPARDITVHSTALRGDTTTFKAGRSPSLVDTRFGLGDGMVTDYPFDRFTAPLAFRAETEDGTGVPVNLTVINTDSFFTVTKDAPDDSGELSALTVTVGRSTATIAFAVFITVFMWCLALAAIITCWFVLAEDKGMIFPAKTFVAALLFSLIPLRNAMPGNPPIGSLVDFGAFFIAEALIAISLITMVIRSYLGERRLKRRTREPSAT